MTPDEMRRVRFGRAPFGHRGYDTAEVDAFLSRVAAAFGGRGALTTADIRGAEFRTAPLGHRGYHREDVDDFLDHACVALEFVRRGVPSRPAAATALTPDDVRRTRFSGPPYGQAGYAAGEVDVFLDRVAATLAHTGPTALTAAEIRAATFGLAHAGSAAYRIDEVDAFREAAARIRSKQV
jgi:DivIVA domain-containing protein